MTSIKENEIIKNLLNGWAYTRRHTYELLDSLRNKDLDFIPQGSLRFQDLQHQFTYMGSNQLAFTNRI